ncbi:MAG: adenosine kinase [Holophagales bacterium]|nr:adenosine kinase [Holophagales bacterium]MYH26576.1 adenosine kinase [Holophagales bacterium]
MAGPPRDTDPELVGIENAILDLLVRVEDRHLDEMGLDKGIMKLVTAEEQEAILDHVLNRDGEILQPEIEAGGSCANVLRAASLLGVDASYSSAVAGDDTGRLFERGLNASRVRNRLARIDGVTGTSVVLVTPDGERTMNTHLGVCRKYRPEHVPEDDIRRSRIFFTTGYIWDTPNQIDAIEHAIEVARAAGAKLAIDVADPFAVRRSRDHLMRHKEHGFDILFANAEEARMMTGLGPQAAASELAKTIEVVAVKDGVRGAWVRRGDEVHRVPAHQVEVVDTTGAGDCFAAGFLYGLLRGLPIRTCCEIGIAMAADTITHLGVKLSPDIRARLTAIEQRQATAVH